jgi:hypothetical protein
MLIQQDLLGEELPGRWRPSITGGPWGALSVSFITRWIMAAAGTRYTPIYM